MLSGTTGLFGLEVGLRDLHDVLDIRVGSTPITTTLRAAMETIA